jgi:hypothetical protein
MHDKLNVSLTTEMPSESQNRRVSEVHEDAPLPWAPTLVMA